MATPSNRVTLVAVPVFPEPWQRAQLVGGHVLDHVAIGWERAPGPGAELIGWLELVSFLWH